MSKRRDNALAAIERVVFKPEAPPIVVALTGGWGEGKSYFWTHAVLPKFSSRAPGYISVFGAESLAIIRERVCISTFSEPRMDGRKKAKEIGGAMVRALGHLADHWTGKIGAPESLATEIFQTYRLTEGWVLCIDDVERLSEKVGLENFFGYVTELRDRWKLKVVLIFNKSRIENNSVFRLYQEKVIDREIPFALDMDDIAELVFRDLAIDHIDAVELIKSKAAVLGLRNIRILAKARSYFVEIRDLIGQEPSPEFLKTVLSSILLFTYVKFAADKPDDLTFEALMVHNEWTERLRRSNPTLDDDDQFPDGQLPSLVTMKDLLSKYGFVMADELDQVLIDFVRSDVLDVHRLRALYAGYLKDTQKHELASRFKDMWDKEYHGTFKDNSSQLAHAIKSALSPYLLFVPPNELDFALVVLAALGEESAAQKLFEEFKQTRGAVFEKLDEESMPHGPFGYPPLKEFLHALRKRQTADERSLDELFGEVFKEKFVVRRDADRLNHFATSDIVQYFASHDQPKLTSKLRFLMRETDNPELRQKLSEVIAQLAAMSSLNKMRLEGMGLISNRDAPIPAPWPDQ